MERMLRRLLTSLARKDRAAKARQRQAAAMRCETLENRQLLSTAAPSQGVPPVPFTPDVRPATLSFASTTAEGGQALGNVHDVVREARPLGMRTRMAWSGAGQGGGASQEATPTQDQAGTQTWSQGEVAPGQPEQINTMMWSPEEVAPEYEKLSSDLQAIQDKSEVTPKMLAEVRKDYEALDKASTSDVDRDAIKTLADTVTSIGVQLPTAEQRDQLISQFKNVLNSLGTNDQALVDKTVTDILTVVTASNVTADDVSTIKADREAIKTLQSKDPNWTTPDEFPPFLGDPGGIFLAGLTGGFEPISSTYLPYPTGALGKGFDPVVFATDGSGPAADGHFMLRSFGGPGGAEGGAGEFHTLPALLDGAGGPIQVTTGGAEGGAGGFHTLPALTDGAGGPIQVTSHDLTLSSNSSPAQPSNSQEPTVTLLNSPGNNTRSVGIRPGRFVSQFQAPSFRSNSSSTEGVPVAQTQASGQTGIPKAFRVTRGNGAQLGRIGMTRTARFRSAWGR